MDSLFTCLGLRGGAHRDSQVPPQPVSPARFEKYHDSMDEKKTVFTVLVTGMGAFPKDPGHDEKGHYSEDDNTSHLIAGLLPSKLEAFSEFNATSMDIQILNPTSGKGFAVKTEYGYVRKYCKTLWKNYGNSVDLILHLGMADGWEWYSIERSGWKQGTVKSVDLGYGRRSEPLEYYTLPDDIGETYSDIPGPNPWGKNVPYQLMTGPDLDIDQLAKDAQRTLNNSLRESNQKPIEVKPHPDSGNYLCGFITYESLAQAFVHNYSAKALFCHIPGWRDEERLKIGRDFVCSLIGNIAAQHK